MSRTAFVFTLIVAVSSFVGVSAQNRAIDVHVYLFWQQGCPHCEEQIRTVARTAARDRAVQVHFVELGSVENRRLYAATAEALGMREAAVPLTIVGDTSLVGFWEEGAAASRLEEMIADCRRRECPDVLESVARDLHAVEDRALAMKAIEGEPEVARAPARRIEESKYQIRLPWIGEVNLRSLSLPVLTVALAAVDGFNPCAMWVLVFLIGLLLGLQDRARRWALGIAFLLTTAIVYYGVLAAWLSALLVIGVIGWLRVGIGLLALGGGSYYVWQYVRNPEALCHVAGTSKRERIMARLRAATAEPRFIASLAAIMVLAVGVNFIELLCSAGIPAVYTQVLALTPMPAWQHHAWLALYVLVFLLDDLAIFVVAMFTLELTGAGGRYAHHAQLIGGIVLLAVGVLLIVRPQWLLFG